LHGSVEGARCVFGYAVGGYRPRDERAIGARQSKVIVVREDQARVNRRPGSARVLRPCLLSAGVRIQAPSPGRVGTDRVRMARVIAGRRNEMQVVQVVDAVEPIGIRTSAAC
jgi:hypothetical protein